MRKTLRPRSAAAVAVAALAVLLSGCGIRATPVPVDAGPAPTRTGCSLPDAPDDRESSGSSAGGSGSVRVYLVCSSRVSAVRRHHEGGGGDSAEARLATARGLLASLRAVPSDDEADAGFRTDVPRDLRVDGPRRGDPARALRLNRPVTDLEGFALAQLVCTFAQTPAADDGEAVTLGGPSSAAEPARYVCDNELRNRPAAARSAGQPS